MTKPGIQDYHRNFDILLIEEALAAKSVLSVMKPVIGRKNDDGVVRES